MAGFHSYEQRIAMLETQTEALRQTVTSLLATLQYQSIAHQDKGKEEQEDRELYGNPIDLDVDTVFYAFPRDQKPFIITIMTGWYYNQGTGQFMGRYRQFQWNGEGWIISPVVEVEITHAVTCPLA